MPRERLEELVTRFKDIALYFLDTEAFLATCEEEGIALEPEEIEWLGLNESEDD